MSVPNKRAATTQHQSNKKCQYKILSATHANYTYRQYFYKTHKGEWGLMISSLCTECRTIKCYPSPCRTLTLSLSLTHARQYIDYIYFTSIGQHHVLNEWLDSRNTRASMCGCHLALKKFHLFHSLSRSRVHAVVTMAAAFKQQ